MHFNTRDELSSPNPGSRYYILRSEVVESYFYLWRTTKDPKYREWAWDMVQVFEQKRAWLVNFSLSFPTSPLPPPSLPQVRTASRFGCGGLGGASHKVRLWCPGCICRRWRPTPGAAAAGPSAGSRTSGQPRWCTTTSSRASSWPRRSVKYLYLIFSDDDALDLDRWVLNTEAHPLPVLLPAQH